VEVDAAIGILEEGLVIATEEEAGITGVETRCVVGLIAADEELIEVIALDEAATLDEGVTTGVTGDGVGEDTAGDTIEDEDEVCAEDVSVEVVVVVVVVAVDVDVSVIVWVEHDVTGGPTNSTLSISIAAPV
jgi:hypothetical protein